MRMARSSKRKVRDVIEEHERGIRPSAAALSVVAFGLGSMIVWNAFFGVHQSQSSRDLLASVPKGATTRIHVTPPPKITRSVTIEYDPKVEAVQRELLTTGHYVGMVDGVTGKQTTQAIRKYQSENGLSVSGEITPRLIEHLRYRRKLIAASEVTGSISPKRDVVPVKAAAKIVAKPKLVLTETAAPAKIKKPVTSAEVKAKPGLERVRDVQQRLKNLGFAISAITGEPGPETRAAILKFQMQYGLTMDGMVTGELASALKVAAASQSASAN
jgi:peptidoglycan hydrolase-like protein with peptidoglycan-binding domain